MLALRYYKNRDIRLENISKPSPAKGEVLLKVSDAGLCQTQINEFIEGPLLINTKPNPLSQKSLPLVVGHQYGGVIESVGKGVDKGLITAQVAVLPLITCGTCTYCLKEQEQLCESFVYYGLTGENGGFAEYAIVNKNNIFPLKNPSLLTFLEPLLVCIHALRKIENILANAKVLVLGLGALGIAMAVVLKQLFDTNVHVNDISSQRALRAREAGLEVREKSELIEGSYDIVIDCAGTDSQSNVDIALLESFVYLSKNASILLLGAYFHTVPILPLSIVVNEYSIIGSFGYNNKDVRWLKRRIEELDFDFSKVVDEIALKDIIEEGYYRGEVAKDSFTRIVVKC